MKESFFFQIGIQRERLAWKVQPLKPLKPLKLQTSNPSNPSNLANGSAIALVPIGKSRGGVRCSEPDFAQEMKEKFFF